MLKPIMTASGGAEKVGPGAAHVTGADIIKYTSMESISACGIVLPPMIPRAAGYDGYMYHLR
jgi:hypothetical protein